MTARAVQTRCLWFCDSMIGRSEQKCALPRAVAGQRSTVCPRVFQSVLCSRCRSRQPAHPRGTLPHPRKGAEPTMVRAHATRHVLSGHLMWQREWLWLWSIWSAGVWRVR